MKALKIILGVATVALIVVLSSTNPKREQSPPVYDAAHEIQIRGVVQEVQEFFCPVSDDQGTHVMLKTDNGVLQVHVAPARFLRSQEIRFNPGDQLLVVGSRLRYMGADALLAREIVRGNEVLILRDHQGNPVWPR
jgi:hypothetical protein